MRRVERHACGIREFNDGNPAVLVADYSSPVFGGVDAQFVTEFIGGPFTAANHQLPSRRTPKAKLRRPPSETLNSRGTDKAAAVSFSVLLAGTVGSKAPSGHLSPGGARFWRASKVFCQSHGATPSGGTAPKYAGKVGSFLPAPSVARGERLAGRRKFGLAGSEDSRVST